MDFPYHSMNYISPKTSRPNIQISGVKFLRKKFQNGYYFLRHKYQVGNICQWCLNSRAGSGVAQGYPGNTGSAACPVPSPVHSRSSRGKLTEPSISWPVKGIQNWALSVRDAALADLEFLQWLVRRTAFTSSHCLCHHGREWNAYSWNFSEVICRHESQRDGALFPQ